MAFLSGVLEAVKNTQTYNVGKKHLNDNVVSLINKYLCSGHDGFTKLLPRLTKEIEKYNKEVRESNDKIKKPIEDLLNQVGDVLNDNAVSGKRTSTDEQIKEAVRSADRLATDCVIFSSKISETLKLAKPNILDLHHALRKKIKHAVTFIQSECDLLAVLSNKEESDRVAVENKVAEQLDNVKSNVSKHVVKEVKTFQKAVDKQLKALKNFIEMLDAKLGGYVEGVEKWLRDQEKEVINNIEKQLQNILEAVDVSKGAAENKNAIIQAVKGIGTQAATLHSKFTDLKGKYNDVYKLLMGTHGVDKSGVVGQLENIFEKQQAVVKNITLEKFKENSYDGWDVNGKIGMLLVRIKNNVEEYVSELGTVLGRAVTDAKEINGWTSGNASGIYTGVQTLKSSLNGKSVELANLLETSVASGDSSSKAVENALYSLKPAKSMLERVSGSSSLLSAFGEAIGKQAIAKSINTPILTLLQETVKKSVKKLQEETDEVVLTTIKNKVRTLDDALIQEAQQAQAALDRHAKEVSQHINEFCKTVERLAGNGDGVKGQLKLLKDRATIFFEAMEKEITTLRTTRLIKVSEATEYLLTQTATWALNTVSSIIKDLGDHITSSKDNVLKVVNKRYVSSVKQLLTAFAQKVTEELRELPGEIDEDLTIGFKGLMGKMENSINSNLVHNEKLGDLSFNFLRFFGPVKDYVSSEIERVHDENMSKKNPKGDTKDTYAAKLQTIFDAVTGLCTHISSKNRYDHRIPGLLDTLLSAIAELKPQTFEKSNTPILDGITKGLQKFVDQMRKVYISTYDGQKIDWAKNERDKQNCAKACLTISHTLFHELYCLFYHGATKWREYSMVGEKNKDELSKYLMIQGFNVENLKKDHSGNYVAVCLKNAFKDKYEFHTLPDKSHTNFNLYLTSIDRENGFVAQLFNYVETYNKLCHISDSSAGTQPCSVYHMLIWLNGLPHRSVYDKLNFDYFSELFEKPDSADTEGIELEGLSLSDLNAETLAAYPHDVTVTNLTEALTDVCSQSYYLLTSFLGHGHANGVYACDYSNNAFNLSYPSSPGACFEMLVDFVNRLYRQLFFLYTQCSNDENCSGWRNCWYGQHVGGSAWNCNTMQCPNQKGNQNHKQTCNQKCDQTVECGIKSPLQSFLEDGLPGFLPHSFSKPGCKLTCTVSNHRGLPCITPMGFADLSVAASCTQQGVHLKNILKDFCGTKAAPLTQLCAQLTCLLQKPPQTLGDIFAFYYSYLEEWADGFYERPQKDKTYTGDAFREAVNDAYFGKQYEHLNPATLVSSSKHSDEHSKGNLCIIADCTSGSVAPCGLYVKSMTQEITKYYSAEHKANHLSWIVYITETFCDLLKKLCDDCCKKCGPAGSKCHVKSCDEKCEIKYSDDKMNSVEDKSHKHDCKSIINCRDTHPTLYKYGFTFGNTWALNGSRNEQRAKRTCKDFCEALKKMLAEGSVLITLRRQIDQFLWAIRLNFSITVLALWLLSFLYLLHIMVIRLDLLHIKSHLHSPSSHRIAAQSLLAAGRVNKLNRVFYLQP